MGVANVFSTSGVGTVFTYTSSGNFVVVLIVDKGSSMRCSMNYADSSGFTTPGGVGLYNLSDGWVIDVTWLGEA